MNLRALTSGDFHFRLQRAMEEYVISAWRETVVGVRFVVDPAQANTHPCLDSLMRLGLERLP